MTQTQTATTKLTANEEKFAQALYQAYTTQKPLTEKDWQATVTDDAAAYNVQARLTELKNETVGGYKVSLTSEQTQKMFASDSPLYGAQVKSHFLASPVKRSLKTLMEPLVEVELEFRAKEDLHSNDSLDDLMKKTTVAAGMEIPDSRFSNWFPKLSKYMVMSDAAVGGLVLYGKEFATNDVFKDVAAAATVKCQLFHNDKKVTEGLSSEVLGNPLKSLHWLVAKLAEQGKVFKAGQMVSSGTFVLPPKLTVGKWSARFDHGLGNVDFEVTD
ncbi:MAG: 2-keto-4-pentenoate hydratase [Liquorilactobacillus ghanensis]|uniref:2-keto-4-pentenoate hydratase n=1 Tax=Liquorilactobacillus ghanensis TaxID=399370 RepID=UPI0039E7EA04